MDKCNFKRASDICQSLILFIWGLTLAIYFNATWIIPQMMLLAFFLSVVLPDFGKELVETIWDLISKILGLAFSMLLSLAYWSDDRLPMGLKQIFIALTGLLFIFILMYWLQKFMSKQKVG